MADGEFKLIDWIRRQRGLDPTAVPIGIGDDMAGLNLAGQGLVLVTTDIRLDGVHFIAAETPLRQIGYKAFACSLSDAAAMASLPKAAVAAVALPRDWPMGSAQQLTLGLLDAADRYDCPLVGGDVTSWDRPLAVNVTLLSTESGVPAVRRNGARPGDWIMVTGELGGSLASGRHLNFTPRVREARALASSVRLTAMIDLSDGLSSDLGHICDESGVGAIVYADRLPLSPASRQKADPVSAALNDGEDFELCFTCSPEDGQRLLTARPAEVLVTQVGEITVDRQRWLVLAEGRRPLLAGGYEHFKGQSR